MPVRRDNLDSFDYTPPPSAVNARRVLIKPNLGYASPHPVTADLQVLQRVIEGVRRVAPDAEILLVEGSSESASAEEIAGKLCGDLLALPGVRFLDADSLPMKEYSGTEQTENRFKSFLAPAILSQVDCRISVAALKCTRLHDAPLISGSIKNLFGLLPRARYHARSPVKRGLLHRPEVHQTIVQVFRILGTLFDGAVVGGTEFIDSSSWKPTRKDARPFHQVIWGDDLLETDLQALECAGLPVCACLESLREERLCKPVFPIPESATLIETHVSNSVPPLSEPVLKADAPSAADIVPIVTANVTPQPPAYSVKIREMPSSDRPREHLVESGPGSLTITELIAIQLRTGTRERSALELAAQLISSFGDLRGVAAASLEDLAGIKGVGQVKAIQILAAIELGRRLVIFSGGERPAIQNPGDVVLLMSDLRIQKQEHFRVLLLDTKNRVIKIAPVTIGLLDSSLVHPREVFRQAIQSSAAAIIAVHNHPSGDPTPSREDRAVTNRLLEAGKLLGIDLLDHIIIGDDRHVSLKEQGLL